MALEIGDKAPAFKLPEAPGQEVDVGAYMGHDKVVLIFFLLAFSSVCTRELGTMATSWEEWDELGARVFGISVDSPFVTQRFREDAKIPFPILSDFNRVVTRRYDVLHEQLLGLEGVAKRSVFVIGADGRIAYKWVSEDHGVEPDYEEVRRAVRDA